MHRIRPRYLDPDPADDPRLVDVLVREEHVREEPDEEDEEEDDAERDDQDDEDDDEGYSE
jgi:hypothetical protein